VPTELALERISQSDISVFSVLVRKKNSVDDMYYAIGVEDITVCHRGIVHLKIDQRSLSVFGLRQRKDCKEIT
jgi:hypothetical protein